MGVDGIYGLSGSGLDIESLVKVGMMSKQSQYDKMYQKEMQNTWLKEAYNDVYTKIKDFQSVTSGFKLQSNMNAMSAASNNTSAVTATANGAAAAMNHKVSVEAVASNAYVMTGMKADGSAQTIDRASGATSSNLLKDVLYKQVEGIGQEADGTNKYRITNADGSTREVKGSDVAISLKIKDTADGEAHDITYTFDDLIQDSKSLYDLASAVGASGANIQGGYDAANDSFSLYNKQSGKDNIIDIMGENEDSVALLNAMHLASYDAGSNSLTDLQSFSTGASQVTAGTNAKATVDGKTYELDSNVKNIGGVTYTFNNVTKPGETATITVTQNTDKIVDQVKSFVEAYNTLLDDLNSKLAEEKFADYKPLTKEQEAEMNEDQVKKWNEKAKSGLLHNDSTVRSLVSSMRDALYMPVEAVGSKYNSLSAIGISTTNTKGHITLDEDKLTKALAEDPDCVYQLFASDQDSAYIAGSTTKKQLSDYEQRMDYKNTGVANRLYNAMGTYMKSISDYAGTTTKTDDNSYLGKMITNIHNKMTSYKTQMDAYETALYKKYDAMEVALSKMGMQLGYITGYSN